MPAALQPLPFRVDMLCGSLCETGGVTDIGLPGYPDILCGGLAESSIEDIGLPLFTDILAGMLSEQHFEIDEGGFTVADIYMDVVFGSLVTFRMFADQIEQPIFFFEHDEHTSGFDAEDRHTGGGVEHSGS